LPTKFFFFEALQNTEQIPLVQEKIYILALGRSPCNSEEIVWNLGNIATKMEMDLFKNLFEKSVIQDLKWNQVEYLWADLSCLHGNYRPGMANRHGHANPCPCGSSSKKGYWKAKTWNRSNRREPRGPEFYGED